VQLERDLTDPFKNTTQPFARLRTMDAGMGAGKHNSPHGDRLPALRQMVGEQGDGV